MINHLHPPFSLVPFDMLVEAYQLPTPANCSLEPKDPSNSQAQLGVNDNGHMDIVGQ